MEACVFCLRTRDVVFEFDITLSSLGYYETRMSHTYCVRTSQARQVAEHQKIAADIVCFQYEQRNNFTAHIHPL